VQVAATGLSADAEEYARRLEEQPDEQVDAWAMELLRDLSIRRGVRRVLEDFMKAAALGPRELERVFAAGGCPPSTVGYTDRGEIMVPAVSLYCLVSGIRSQTTDGGKRLRRFLASNFHEIAYI